MSLYEHNPNTIHSRNSRRQRPVSIGSFRKNYKSHQISTQFELRPATSQLSNKKNNYHDESITRSRKPYQSNIQASPRQELKIIKESNIFPMIQFCQRSFRQLLKEVEFDAQVKSLPPEDRRCETLFQIAFDIFQEVSFAMLGLLICQHQITRSYHIYFSDCDLVPISKCCQSPVELQISQLNQGSIQCNNQFCQQKKLSTFQLTTLETEMLWQNDPYSLSAPNKGLLFQSKISQLITTGQYRSTNLSRQLKQVRVSSQQVPIKPKTALNKSYQIDATNSFNEQSNVENPLAPVIKSPVQYRLSLVENIILQGKVFSKDFSFQLQSPKKKNKNTRVDSVQEIEEMISSILNRKDQGQFSKFNTRQNTRQNTFLVK